MEKRQERGRKDTEIRCKGDKEKAAKKKASCVEMSKGSSNKQQEE